MNVCTGIPERQVLPRFVDHARDLAIASVPSTSGTADGAPRRVRHPVAGGRVGISILVLDFKHAFMTVPANPGEQRYNCCMVEQPLQRNRPPLDPGEPAGGTFIAWRVLGFGGRPYPLLYARVATQVARLTQALVHESAWVAGAPWAPARLQL